MEGERERNDIKERNLLLSAFLAVSARSLLPICVNILDGFFFYFSVQTGCFKDMVERERQREREREPVGYSERMSMRILYFLEKKLSRFLSRFVRNIQPLVREKLSHWTESDLVHIRTFVHFSFYFKFSSLMSDFIHILLFPFSSRTSLQFFFFFFLK